MKHFEKLTREEMKNIAGGVADTCTVTVQCYKATISCSGKTCSYQAPGLFDKGYVQCDNGAKTSCE